MRVEEMYLIKAEALAMSGQPAAGAQVLTDFVKTYRDPAFTLTAGTAEAVQDAVWMQRRVELWGERSRLLRISSASARASTAAT